MAEHIHFDDIKFSVKEMLNIIKECQSETFIEVAEEYNVFDSMRRDLNLLNIRSQHDEEDEQ